VLKHVREQGRDMLKRATSKLESCRRCTRRDPHRPRSKNGSFFVDFGRNLQGTLQLDLQLASGVAGPRVQLTLGEEL